MPRPAVDPQTKAVLDQYCVTCHNPRSKTGGFILDTASLDRVTAHREDWEKVVRKLRLGVMPPLGSRRPDEAAYERLIASLETELDAPAASHPHPGRPVLHRLNRAEYANAIRDLLGLTVDVAALLPPDDAAYGFDNVADALGSSPALLQAYLGAARKISAVAAGNPRVGVNRDTYSARQDLSQDQHLEGLPLGTQGGLVATHTFPVDGDYEFQLRLWRTNLSAMRGLQDPHQVEIALDGDRILLATIGGDEDLVKLQKNPTATSDEIEAAKLHVRRAREGRRAHDNRGVSRGGALDARNRAPPAVHPRLQQSVRCRGRAARPEPQRRRPVQCGADRAAALRPLVRLSARPVAPKLAGIVSERSRMRPPHHRECWTEGLSPAAQSAGARWAVGVLRDGPQRAPPSTPGSSSRCGEFSPARRLYFARSASRRTYRPARRTGFPATSWRPGCRSFSGAAFPTKSCCGWPATGTLSKPEVLSAQVRRMLADRKSSALVENFAGQWLQLRNLRGIVPNPETFPDFDDNLRQAFRREAELFFAHVVRERSQRPRSDDRRRRRSSTNGSRGTTAFPTSSAAISVRVRLTDESRRGLLGKGAVLMVTSHATTTSPVLRGKWVLDNLLGAPPPPPTAERAGAEGTRGPGNPPSTMRAADGAAPRRPGVRRLPQADGSPRLCARELRCRSAPGGPPNVGGVALDTADVLPDGTRIEGVAACGRRCSKRPEVFVQTLTEKLLLYAVGRGLTPEDMPAVRAIVRGARGRDYRFSSLVMGICHSVPFQMRMKRSVRRE